MNNKALLRRISFVMFTLALIFVCYALGHPEAGRAFYIGSLYIGAAFWRKVYLLYVIVMIALFIASFFNKNK